MSKELQKFRQKIDQIDKQLLETLAQRFKITKKIGEYKTKHSLPVFDKKREKEILQKRDSMVKKLGLDRKLVTKIFKTIIKEVKINHQKIKKIKYTKQNERKTKLSLKGLKIGYLGLKGTFSSEVSQRIFPKKSELLGFSTIREVFEAVNNDEVDFGVVPVENSISGIVSETINSLIEYPLKVSGSFNLKIRQCLLARTKNKEEIKIIKTHPQAFFQSKKWLEKNLKDFSFQESSSTVEPILKTKDKKVGFIGNEALAKKYNLYILAKDIQEDKNNLTKFYLISKKENKELEKKLKAKKTLILLAVYDRVGILRDILDVFAKNNLNLTGLHSIPSRLKPWDYFFFLEIEIPYYSPLIKSVLKKIEKYCPIIRLIGTS